MVYPVDFGSGHLAHFLLVGGLPDLCVCRSVEAHKLPPQSHRLYRVGRVTIGPQLLG